MNIDMELCGVVGYDVVWCDVVKCGFINLLISLHNNFGNGPTFSYRS